MRRTILLPWFALATSAAAAQTAAPPAHSLRGSVYDSIGLRPLAGAVVQAVAVDDPHSRTFTATTDSLGRYVLTGLPGGRFAVGFQHDALNAFGLESPIRAISLGADTSNVLDLGVPSGPTARATLCPGRDPSHPGLVAGYVTDAAAGEPLSSATVLVQWVELNLHGGKLQSSPHRVMASITDDGAYRACGIPVDGPVTVRVSSKNHHVIEAELTLPPAGVQRHDFHLVDEAQTKGNAAIALRLIDATGASLPSGRASIPELTREASVDRGSVVIDSLPAGTWFVDLRTLGYQPRLLLLDATTDKAPQTVTMIRTDPVLDTVRVVSAQVKRDSQVVRDIEKRLLTAHGTIIRADNPSILSASEASSALRAATGFDFKDPINVQARVYGTGAPCISQPSANTINYGLSASTPNTTKFMAVYLNGDRVPEGLEAINRMVPVKAILAVEAYPDVTTAPFIWRTNDACAVVLFWTKH